VSGFDFRQAQALYFVVMAASMHHSVDLPEALTPMARRALDLFGDAARAAYGEGLVQLVLFGSRSRGEARSDSDIDVAVVLRELRDRRADRDRLADLAYDAIVETNMDIQTVPVSLDEWEHPEHHTNPALIRTIKRDGIVVKAQHDLRPAGQSVPFS
jgi:predicted nucleotidyltransferase